MKAKLKIFGLTALIIIVYSSSVFCKNINNNISIADSVDPSKLRETYSLFSEYYKNKDYKSAEPYGWQVIQTDPKMFAKWIYYKMEDVLWYLRDSASLAPEQVKAIDDTIMYFYDTAMENYPDDKGYFQMRKAFVAETWLNWDADKVITEYEKATQLNPNMSSYYYDRLGQLYFQKAEENPEYKQKGIDLYMMLSEKEPDNQQWPAILANNVEDQGELVRILKEQWMKDKENGEKAYKYADMAQKASMFEESIEPLEFLVSKTPDGVNYWAKLANAYQKVDNLDKAEGAYKKLIELEPQNKNHYLNLGIIYDSKGQSAAARTQYQKASDVGNGWGLPIYYEGLLYEKAARGCGEFNFEAKLVYQLAVDTYRRAKSMDPSVTQAQDRANAL
ncbi:MAG: tetratricopeptide repeat protein, partial [Ignavibacteriaceae bacterium]